MYALYVEILFDWIQECLWEPMSDTAERVSDPGFWMGRHARALLLELKARVLSGEAFFAT